MLTQQIIALAVIVFFLARLWRQKKDAKISINEFFIWLSLWLSIAVAVVFLKKIDFVVRALGFSSSGLGVLQYSAIIIILYLIFKLRIRLRKIENDITNIVRHLSLNEKNENSDHK